MLILLKIVGALAALLGAFASPATAAVMNAGSSGGSSRTVLTMLVVLLASTLCRRG